jgi:redox-sensitive bicupin YhaK (pirin superfamily)
MATRYYLAKDRGKISTDWLVSYYSFNFETMDQFEKIRFGQLRILNNDTIQAGSGFGIHSHDNMEIVTIPLSGGLTHKDSLGNIHQIIPGDIQVMTAGTGIRHSEYNLFDDRDTNFLQIWVFPDRRGLAPRYDQRRFDLENRANRWDLLIAPQGQAPLYINQAAYFSRADLDAGNRLHYALHNDNSGVLVYVIDGEIIIDSETFIPGDAAGYTGRVTLHIKAANRADILAIEVPLNN